MKVISVHPCGVYKAGRDGWKYTYAEDTGRSVVSFISNESFNSAAGAKQAMREHVALLRKQYCL